MGDVSEQEQAWDRLARAKGYRCEACDSLIPYGEQNVYFERKLCGRCAHNLDKDN